MVLYISSPKTITSAHRARQSLSRKRSWTAVRRRRENGDRASARLQGLYAQVCVSGQGERETASVTYYAKNMNVTLQEWKAHRAGDKKGKRQSTVEPVFGTLTQFMGLRKINTIGLAQANKVMHLSAIAYNLKKYLKFDQRLVKSGAGKLALAALVKSTARFLFGPSVKHRKLTFEYWS